MRPTIKDIAEAAGVTHGVVSSVLNGKSVRSRASLETAERIRQIARDLGYRPSAFARSFRSSETMSIGVIHGDGLVRLRFDDGSRYFAALIDGVIDGAFSHGYTVSFCPRLLGPNSTVALADGRFDGYIWYSTNPFPEAVRAIRECPYPIVLIHSPADHFDHKIPTVLSDNEGGIRLALEHLYELGHRSVAFACSFCFMYSEAVIRRDACLSIGESMGMEVTVLDIDEDKAQIPIKWLVNRAFTAVIGHNEGCAIEVMKLFQAAGARVPEDISIVGFDSTDFCLFQHPPLTAVRQELNVLGETAVNRLVEILRGEEAQIETVIDCALDIRRSTGPAPIRQIR